MPENLGDSSDPRFQPTALIEDGGHMYEVIGEMAQPAQQVFGCRPGAPIVTLAAVDCLTEATVQLDVARVRRGCRLVRAAPASTCPAAYER
jgi:hypothetical protein